MQFTKPLYLLLLIPAVYYTCVLSRKSLADMSVFRSRLALGLRMFIILCLIFSLAGARVVKDISQQCVVFVLDVSDSIPKKDQEAALAFINQSIKKIKKSQKVGLVVFGGESSVELAPNNLNKVERIYSVPSTSQTDIAQALGLAVASFPEQCRKKIVLFSDGNETIGKAVEQAALAGANDVSIDVVPVSGELPREALLDKLICQNSVKVGEPFDVKVVAISKQAAAGRIRMLRNGAPAGDKIVDLNKGKSIFTFRQSIPKAGSYEYQAILECDEDTRPENNIATAYTMVKGKPKVLYLEGKEGQGTYLAKALKSNDIDVEERGRAGIPNSLEDLRGYDMIVLSDIPAWNMVPEQMQMINSAVKDLGIGLTMVGGEESFGAGGYFDTPIEKALPVDMSIRKDKVLPSLSVVIVMDKSGSMGAVQDGRQKIQLANDAAAAVVKMLQPIDKVGVIICHDFPVDVVKLTHARNKGPIYHEISTIGAEGGGIMVGASMQMAYDMIKGAGTRQKHIILLADGSDCDQQEGVVALAQKMAREKITVTAVALGNGPHVPFLKAVAYSGKGDFYLAERGRDLKAIYTKDVMAVSKSLIIEEPFVPKMNTSSPELNGINPVPPLLGYVSTTPKPAASVSAVSHKNDPILATWQYGLGRSAAFTSDCKSRWAARWVAWQDYNKFWSQVIRSTMRKSAPGDFQTTVNVLGGFGNVVIDAVDDKGNFLNFFQFNGSVVGPDLKTRSLNIEQTGPGRYESSFDAREVGNYVVNVSKKGKNSPDVSVISIPYPPEYKDIAPDFALLKRIADETGGHYAPSAENIFKGKFRKSLSYNDLWPVLTMLAMLLLPVDVAVRRIGMSPEQAAEGYQIVVDKISRLRAGRRNRKIAAAERSDSVTTLLKSKERTKPEQPDKPVIKPVIEIKEKKIEKPASKPVNEVPSQDEDQGDLTSRLLAAKRRAKQDKD